MTRPKCPVCGRDTANTDNVAGQRRYRCINTKCPEFLRKLLYPEGETK